MCGRYLLEASPAEVSRAFAIDVRDNFPPRYNITPTQPVAVIAIDERRARAYRLMRWGFIPSWAKKDYLDRVGSRPLINARAETVAEKPTFRNAWKRRRALLPADGFYEWKGEAGARRPFCIRLADTAVFAFAGIWETAVDPDGGEIDTVAILTIGAGPDMRALHAREPVVIAPPDYERWLDPDETRLDGLAALLVARAEGFWRAHEVSPAVNNARSEGRSLIDPL